MLTVATRCHTTGGAPAMNRTSPAWSAMKFKMAPWGDTFGVCVDRFGTNRMVNATAQSA
jgi:uncharacterized glyoxalase superfamily protein PhnB